MRIVTIDAALLHAVRPCVTNGLPAFKFLDPGKMLLGMLGQMTDGLAFESILASLIFAPGKGIVAVKPDVGTRAAAVNSLAQLDRQGRRQRDGPILAMVFMRCLRRLTISSE